MVEKSTNVCRSLDSRGARSKFPYLMKVFPFWIMSSSKCSRSRYKLVWRPSPDNYNLIRIQNKRQSATFRKKNLWFRKKMERKKHTKITIKDRQATCIRKRAPADGSRQRWSDSCDCHTREYSINVPACHRVFWSRLYSQTRTSAAWETSLSYDVTCLTFQTFFSSPSLSLIVKRLDKLVKIFPMW